MEAVYFSGAEKNVGVVLHKSKRRDEQMAENLKGRQCASALLGNARSVGNVLYLRIQKNVCILLYLRLQVYYNAYIFVFFIFV